MRFSNGLVLTGVSMIALAAPAFAQDAADNTDNADDTEIVVTGTLIRGAEVTGSQTLSVDTTAILQQGAISTNEILGLVPQIANAFNGRFETDPRGAKSITINRPNLRNMPGTSSATGSVTLVLVDGIRMTPVGVREAAIDPDIVPAAVLQGVDVVTDGGSSLYGADAVAGVINFRTRRKFDGIKVDGNYGFGTTLSHYDQWDASIIAGTSWNSGNAYISGGYSSRDFVSGGETDWVNGVRYRPDASTYLTSTQCINPVGTESRYYHYGPGDTQWTKNPSAPGAGDFAIGSACDQTGAGTYLPKQTRANVFGSLSQEVSDTIDLRVTGYWTKRETKLWSYPLGYTTAAKAPVFPTGQPVGSLFTWPGGIGFSFGANSAYRNRPSELGFKTWGITPELTARLGGDWQLRTTVHFGQSNNYQRWPEVNGTRTANYINAGQLNPQMVSAASAAVIDDILNYETAQDTIQKMFLFRSIADGSIFSLPGGDAKLAVGVEYQRPSAKIRLGTDDRGAIDAKPYQKSHRNSKSVFGEVSLPVTDFIDVSASLRYDDYSDFGSTTNPNIGVSMKPVSWLKVYGHWNKSFNAPTVLDTLPLGLGRQGGTIYCSTCNPPVSPTDPLGLWNGSGSKSLVLEGPGVGIKPQKATSWAIGFEATPVSRLRLGGQFYSIRFKNIIGGVDVTNQQSYIDFPQYFTFNPDPAEYEAIISTLANADFVRSQIAQGDVAVIVDRRTTNLNSAKLEGVDFHLYYDLDISAGHFAFGLTGTKATKATLATGALVANQLGLNSPEFTATSFLAWNKDKTSARVTVNYSGKFHDGGPDYLGNRVVSSPFVTTNLFLGYAFDDEDGALAGTSLRLGVDNVFNEKPDYVKRSSASLLSYLNWTLGRVVKLGISKEF